MVIVEIIVFDMGSFKKYVFKWGGGGVLQNDTECYRGGGGGS